VNCRLILAGREALDRLAGNTFTCLAAFSRGVYLKNAGGKLVCLLQEGLEPGPLNAFCAPWPEECLPLPGTPVARADNSLFWPGVSLWLRGAALWTPPSIPTKANPLRELTPPEIFLEALADLGPGADFSPLFSRFLAGAALPEAPSPLLEAGARAISPLREWLRSPREADGLARPPAPDIRGLLGLGPGLTPSGDDVLGGAMIALRLTGRGQAADALYGAIRSRPDQTNTVSAAHLELAASGQGAEALHLLLASLLQGGFSREAAARLAGVGHCSGWDMLLGAALALYSHL
jgi:hypothetical protein